MSNHALENLCPSVRVNSELKFTLAVLTVVPENHEEYSWTQGFIFQVDKRHYTKKYLVDTKVYYLEFRHYEHDNITQNLLKMSNTYEFYILLH